MLATSETRSFSLFFYLDDGIQWGQGAQIGFDAVFHTFNSIISGLDLCPPFFSLPGALQASSADIELTSNTGTPGKWVFRLDTVVVIEPGGE